jgi:hypothetical protein
MAQQEDEDLFQLLVHKVIKIERWSLAGTHALKVRRQTFNPAPW